MTDFLGEALSRDPRAIAADDGERRWSWETLDREARRAESLLREAGAAPGARIALLLHPGLEPLATLHGAFRTGALVAPLDPRLTAPEQAAAFEALDPSVVVDERGVRPRDRRRPEIGLPHPAEVVLWTSGTSGSPRGVLLTAAGLRASAAAAARRLDLAADDVWYASLSPAHVGGLALLVRAAILGCGLQLRGRFSIDALVELVESGAVTHASLVPTMLLRFLEARAASPPPSTLRCLLIGGAHTPPDLVERALAAGLPLALTWGMTEATSQAATAPPVEVRANPHSVGRPLSGVELRLSPEGEVQLRGPTISPGLLDGRRLTDGDGWLSTGDLGEQDGRGHLRITGRRSDRIISGGVTIDAHEIEAVLRAHPEVRDGCVVGTPDRVWGERVAALVVGTATDEALDRWLRTHLSPAKLPRTLRRADALPLNRNGKVDRAAVRRRLAAAEGPPTGERGDFDHGHR